MDSKGDKAIMMSEEEDRISNLPEDIIHRILSFLDMKYAVRTCTLSHRWKLIWTSIPHLNLNSFSFRTLPMFAKFVKNILSHRNNLTEVSTVKLTFTGSVTQFFVRSIIKYAYSHNIREMTIIFHNKRFIRFPESFFSSHTLKHLTISSNLKFFLNWPCSLTDSAWDFPALETLYLSNMKITDGVEMSPDLFSKCVNLKSLTLHQFCLLGVDVFNIIAPKLSNLTLTDPFVFPKVFNVVAPKLENLTASVSCANNAVSSSYLQLPTYRDHSTLKLSTGFDSLDKVHLNLSLPTNRKKAEDVNVPMLLESFQKLRSAKFLILNVDIIEVLSRFMDQVSRGPCPFNNLKCLKIEKQNDRVATMPIQVRNYLLENSLSAIVIMELPQPLKRSRQQDYKDTMAKKSAKLDTVHHQREALAKELAFLDTKLQMQDELIAKQKAMLQALQSELIKSKMAELQVQVERGNPDYDLIHSMGNDIKTVMDLVPESLKLIMEAQFSSKYEEVKSSVFTKIDGSQWAKIETELGDLRLSQDKNVPTSSNVAMAVEPS